MEGFADEESSRRHQGRIAEGLGRTRPADTRVCLVALPKSFAPASGLATTNVLWIVVTTGSKPACNRRQPRKFLLQHFPVLFSEGVDKSSLHPFPPRQTPSKHTRTLAG